MNLGKMNISVRVFLPAPVSWTWIIALTLGILIADTPAMAQTTKNDPGTGAWAEEAKKFRKDRAKVKEALEKKDQEALKKIWEERKREATHGGVPQGGGGGRHPLQQAPGYR